MKLLDRSARSPRKFWKSSRRRDSGDNHDQLLERRLLFKLKRLRSRRKLLKAVWAESGRWSFQVEDHHVVRRRRTWKRDSSFGRRKSEEAVLLQTQGREAAITFGKSASGAGRFISTLSVGSARTRDQSDTCRNIFWVENKCITVKGGNTDVAALPIERRGLSPVRLRQPFFPHKRSSRKPPFNDALSILKLRDNCNVEQKGCPLSPLSLDNIPYFFGRG